MLCYYRFPETLGGVAFHEHRLSVEREPQLLTEAQQVGTLGVGDANPMPALAGPNQRGVHQFQAAALIEEAWDDLDAPALFQEAPLNEVRVWYENGGARRL
jgi:hypothetical protein